MILITIIVLLISAPFIWWYLVLQKYKSLNSIPGPKPLPFVGNATDLGSTPQEFLKNCCKFSDQYGTIFKIYIGNDLKVFIMKPELVEQILTGNLDIVKSNIYDLLKPWLGIGVLVSEGQKWKTRRRMITSTFHFKILEQFIDVFNSCGNVLVDKLSKECGQNSVDIYPYMNLLSLDIVCETSMGVKILALEGNNTEYVESVRGYLNILITRAFSAVKKFDFLFSFSNQYAEFRRHLKVLHKFSNDIIRKKREEKSKQSRQTNLDDGIKPKVALLDMLLEFEDGHLSNEDIREEMDTVIFAGHDTVTSGLAFTLLALAENPEVQDKIYDEIVSITGEKDVNVTMQHLQDTKYLEMVIKEAQRLYPSVPFIERRLKTGSNIGGYEFPKGTILTLYMYGMAHCDKYFPEPQKFDPDRFLPQNQSERPNYTFIPFGAGSRNCIGQRFAILQMKTIIIKILKNFRILAVPDFKPDLGMAGILKSYNGVYIRLQPRF